MAFCVFCGILSAFLYAVTNICLRQVTHVDAVWVSTVKAMPTCVLVMPWVGWLFLSSQRVFSSAREIGLLIVTSLCVQLFGNVGFQWSLSVLGLVIAVPMVLGTMLVGGAIVGKVLLKEPVGQQKTLAIIILIIATFALTYSAQTAGSADLAATESSTGDPNAGMVLLAVLVNFASGIAYAFLGAMIRRAMQFGMPASSTLFVLSGVGTIFLSTWTLTRIGWSGMLATPSTDMIPMLIAGIFNALAFFAMAKSLQKISVLYVQMLSASQAAMAAAAGWLMFQEPVTTSAILGLVLTAVGLVVAGRRRKARKLEPAPS